MRRFLLSLVVVVLACSGSFAAPAAKNIRTVRDLPGFPVEVLRRTVSAKFYRSLLVSPVAGWVVVRGQLVSSGRLAGMRVTHSELGGAFDKLALQLAKNFTISGAGHTDRQTPASSAALHLVVYKIADGTMVLGVPVSDEAGGNQVDYYGSAFLAVEKDGKWTEIKGPELRRR